MRLGIKLAAIGLLLLAPKTLYYLHPLDTQTVSDRIMTGPVASSGHLYAAVATERKQPKGSDCANETGDTGERGIGDSRDG